MRLLIGIAWLWAFLGLGTAVVDAGPVWLAVMAVVAAGALVTLAVTGHVVQRAVGRG